jgi:hypothetical protein
MPMFRRPASTNRFGVDLLPGHPRFSVIEDQLSAGWQSATSGDLGGSGRPVGMCFFSTSSTIATISSSMTSVQA